MTLFHNHIAASPIFLNASCIHGHAVSLNQVTTTSTAALMPPQMAFHHLRPVSVFVKNAHSATPAATTPAMITPIGDSVNARLSSVHAILTALMIVVITLNALNARIAATTPAAT